MNKYTFTDDRGNTWKRINKKAAEKAFLDGKTLVVVACNIKPFSPWGGSMAISSEYILRKSGFIGYPNRGLLEEYQKQINSFTYHNCINAETGKYPAFYVRG